VTGCVGLRLARAPFHSEDHQFLGPLEAHSGREHRDAAVHTHMAPARAALFVGNSEASGSNAHGGTFASGGYVAKRGAESFMESAHYVVSATTDSRSNAFTSHRCEVPDLLRLAARRLATRERSIPRCQRMRFADSNSIKPAFSMRSRSRSFSTPAGASAPHPSAALRLATVTISVIGSSGEGSKPSCR
jgi:hypothetical protein